MKIPAKASKEQRQHYEHLKAIEKVSEWAASERKTLNDFTNRYTQRQQAATRQMQTAQFVSQQHGHGKGKRH